MASFVGTAGNDVADAAAGTLTGFTGGSVAELQDALGDIFDALGGDDRIIAGDGEDRIRGGLGADMLDGGGGEDTIAYDDHWGAVFVNLNLGRGFGNAAEGDTYVSIEHAVGSMFADYLIGDDGANRLDGGDGTDTLIGSLGADILIGGSNFDTAGYQDNWGSVFVDLRSGQGFGNAAQGDAYVSIENVTGSIFADVLIGRNFEFNALDGQDGDDLLIGGLDGDALTGGNGIDTVSYEDNQGSATANLTTGVGGGGSAAAGDFYFGIENLTGSAYADNFTGDSGSNVLEGRDGADTLTGGDGSDLLYGGAGDDSLDGGGGADLLDGGTGLNSVSYVSASAAIMLDLVNGILGGAAAGDTLINIVHYRGSAFDDQIIVAESTGNVDGHGGNDDLIGSSGDDVIRGSSGNDTIRGGDGIDLLNGDSDEDMIRGGAGNDVLIGGREPDIFLFDTALNAATNVDSLPDFTIEDMFQLDDAIFTGLGLGVLAESAFVMGSAATTTDHRIVYDRTTGAIFYDSDGSGAGDAIQFAALRAGLALGTGTTPTAADFVVI